MEGDDESTCKSMEGLEGSCSVSYAVPPPQDITHNLYNAKATNIVRMNRKRLHKRRMRELVFYILFTGFFFWYMLAWRELPAAYFITAGIKQRMASIGERDDNDFNAVSTPADWYRWVDSALLPILYANDTVTKDLTGKAWRVSHNQLLIGTLRFRQWRNKIEPRSSEIPQLQVLEYYGPAHENRASTADFGVSGVFKVQTECDLTSGVYSSVEHFENGEGSFGCISSIWDLPFNNFTLQEAEEQVKFLQDHEWIDRATRGILIEFYSWSSYYKTMVSHKWFVEFTTGGITITHERYKMFRVGVLYGTADWPAIAGQGVLLLCFLVYAFLLVKSYIAQIRFKGKSAVVYALLGWQLIELVTYVLVGIAVYFRCAWIFNVERRAYADGNMDHSAFPPLERVKTLWIAEQYLCASIACLVVLKAFKFMNTNPRLNLLTRTLVHAAPTLFGLLLIFLATLVAFGCMGYVAFSSQLEEFTSIPSTMAILLRLLVGDVDIYERLRHVSSIYGNMFFAGYLFLAFVVLLNMVLAVIVDSFQQQVQKDGGASPLMEQAGKRVARSWAVRKCGLESTLNTVFFKKKKCLKTMLPEDVIDKLRRYKIATPTAKRLTLDQLAAVLEISQKDALHLMILLDKRNEGILELADLFPDGKMDSFRKQKTVSNRFSSGFSDMWEQRLKALEDWGFQPDPAEMQKLRRSKSRMYSVHSLPPNSSFSPNTSFNSAPKMVTFEQPVSQEATEGGGEEWHMAGDDLTRQPQEVGQRENGEVNFSQQHPHHEVELGATEEIVINVRDMKNNPLMGAAICDLAFLPPPEGTGTTGTTMASTSTNNTRSNNGADVTGTGNGSTNQVQLFDLPYAVNGIYRKKKMRKKKGEQQTTLDGTDNVQAVSSWLPPPATVPTVGRQPSPKTTPRKSPQAQPSTDTKSLKASYYATPLNPPNLPLEELRGPRGDLGLHQSTTHTHVNNASPALTTTTTTDDIPPPTTEDIQRLLQALQSSVQEVVSIASNSTTPTPPPPPPPNGGGWIPAPPNINPACNEVVVETMIEYQKNMKKHTQLLEKFFELQQTHQKVVTQQMDETLNKVDKLEELIICGFRAMVEDVNNANNQISHNISGTTSPTHSILGSPPQLHQHQPLITSSPQQQQHGHTARPYTTMTTAKHPPASLGHSAQQQQQYHSYPGNQPQVGNKISKSNSNQTGAVAMGSVCSTSSPPSSSSVSSICVVGRPQSGVSSNTPSSSSSPHLSSGSSSGTTPLPCTESQHTNSVHRQTPTNGTPTQQQEQHLPRPYTYSAIPLSSTHHSIVDRQYDALH